MKQAAVRRMTSYLLDLRFSQTSIGAAVKTKVPAHDVVSHDGYAVDMPSWQLRLSVIPFLEQWLPDATKGVRSSRAPSSRPKASSHAMGMTAVEKVLALKGGCAAVRPGDVVHPNPDAIMIHDNVVLGAKKELDSIGIDRIA